MVKDQATKTNKTQTQYQLKIVPGTWWLIGYANTQRIQNLSGTDERAQKKGSEWALSVQLKQRKPERVPSLCKKKYTLCTTTACYLSISNANVSKVRAECPANGGDSQGTTESLSLF